jgi:hypothetical protein
MNEEFLGLTLTGWTAVSTVVIALGTRNGLFCVLGVESSATIDFWTGSLKSYRPQFSASKLRKLERNHLVGSPR